MARDRSVKSLSFVYAEVKAELDRERQISTAFAKALELEEFMECIEGSLDDHRFWEIPMSQEQCAAVYAAWKAYNEAHPEERNV